MIKPRYYHTTVGQDHIPDPYRWLDTAIICLCFVAGISLWAFAIVATFGWPSW